MKDFVIFFITLLKKRFVLNSAWLASSYILLGILGILINILITDKYGVNGFGMFSIAMKVYLIVSIIASLGIGVSVLKFTAQGNLSKQELDKCISSAVIISFSFGIVLGVIAYNLSETLKYIFKAEGVDDILKSMSFSIPFFSMNKILFGILNGKQKIKSLSIFQSIRWIILFISILSLGHLSGNLAHTSYSFAITEIILSICLLISIFRNTRFIIKDLMIWIIRHITFGRNSLVSNAIVDLYNYTDVFMIGIFMNTASAGIYAFASDIVKNMIIPSNILQVNFNPIASRLYSENKLEQLHKYAKKLRNSTYLLYIPIIILGILIYPLFVQYLNYEDLKESLSVFVILSIGIFLLSGIKPLFAVTEMAGFPKDRLLINLSTLIINIVLNYFLYFILGMNGVAIATGISYLFSIFALNISTRKRLSFSLLW